MASTRLQNALAILLADATLGAECSSILSGSTLYNWRGPWLIGTTYAVNDVVNDANGTELWYYSLVANNVGHEPPDATRWAIVPSNGNNLVFAGPGQFDSPGVDVTMDTIRIRTLAGSTTNYAFGGSDVFSTDGVHPCTNSFACGFGDVTDADSSFCAAGGSVTGGSPTLHANSCVGIGSQAAVVGNVANAIAVGAAINNSVSNTTQIGYSDPTKVSIDINGLRAINSQVYAAGTAYTVTNASALAHLGTTDPTLTLATAGKYTLRGSFQVDLSGATFAATRTLTVKIRRTNNTAADLANSTRTIVVPITTTLSETLGIYNLPEVLYPAAAGDIVSIFAGLDTAPSAGALNIVAANLVATTVY